MRGHGKEMGRKKRHDGQVIHVVFGPGGGRVQRERTKRAKTDEPTEGPANREPLMDLFTRGEVARLLNVTAGRLGTLDRAGISPTGRRRGRRAYTFSDLIALRTAQTLLDRRVRLRDVTRAINALKRSLPKVTRPLVELRIVSDGQRVVVQTEEGTFDPLLDNQMLLDFGVKALRDDVVRVLRPSAGRERARTAYEMYLHASQLDEDPATMAEAERLYKSAIELDPWLAIAYTNLGNIRFRHHDATAAESLYNKALQIDPKQPEAQYNLGYVMLERGDPERAVPLFLGAIAADPKFADAYFNLAMAYEQIGDSQRARPYWKTYISLEPTGTWTEIARRHL